MKWVAFVLLMGVGTMMLIAGATSLSVLAVSMGIESETVPTLMLGCQANVAVGEENTVNARLTFTYYQNQVDHPFPDEPLMFYLDGAYVGTVYTSESSEPLLCGRASFGVVAYTAGEHTVLVTWAGNDDYQSLSRSITFSAYDPNTSSDPDGDAETTTDGGSPIWGVAGAICIGVAILGGKKLPI